MCGRIRSCGSPALSGEVEICCVLLGSERQRKPGRALCLCHRLDPRPQVVSSVITSLTPSIAKAVEEALAQAAAAEQAAAAAAAAAAEAEAARLAQIEAERRAAAEAEALAAAAEAERQQRIAAANAAAAAAAAEKNSFDSQVSADLGPYVDPVYNFVSSLCSHFDSLYIRCQSRKLNMKWKITVGKTRPTDQTVYSGVQGG